MVEQVKSWLRIKSDDTAIREELEQVIAACKVDLENAGVYFVLETDPLIQQAIKLYAKSYFGYDKDAERFGAAYEHLKQSLALSGAYNKAEEICTFQTKLH